MCEGVPAMLLLTHLIIKRSFMFHILTYLKSWNYNTNVLVRIIVPCLNCRFSYAGNWELVKLIVGTKFRRSHVCLHSQAGNRL